MAIEKAIKIGENEVKMKASAAIPRMYRTKFGRDLFVDFSAMDGGTTMNLEVIENIAYIMAKNAEPDTVPDNVDEWLDSFECLAVYTAAPEILELWGLNTQTLITSKKK